MTTDASRYRLGAVVEATVANASAASVFTQDQKSDCTIVMLEGGTGTGWEAFSTCGSERVSQTVQLAAGEQRRVRIDVGSENFRPQPVVPGVYRVVFTFRWAVVPEGAEPEVAVSEPFEIV